MDLPEASAGRWGHGLTAAKMKNCVWLRPETVAQFTFWTGRLTTTFATRALLDSVAEEGAFSRAVSVAWTVRRLARDETGPDARTKVELIAPQKPTKTASMP